ncbi:MAG: hypothetical protein B7X78_08985, partial [Sphingomonadales bacterium 39-62-4]
MQRFEGKVALITGAASGIGRAAAIRFAQEGARVFCADLILVGAQAVTAEIGGNAGAVQVDVASYASNQAMVAHVMEHAGQLDIAFLNAGLYGAADGLDTVDEALFDTLIAVNLKGPFNGIKAVQPVIAQGGAVIVTASAAGVIGHPANPAYSAAKHGVVGLVKSCVDAFAARGARINAEWAEVPTPEAIRAQDRERLLETILAPVEADESDLEIARTLLEQRSAEDLAAALVRAHRAALPQPEELLSGSDDGRKQAAHRPGFDDVVWFR